MEEELFKLKKADTAEVPPSAAEPMFVEEDYPELGLNRLSSIAHPEVP